MRRLFSNIARCFAQGGIEICTPDHSPENKTADGKDRWLMRTFIQPDGDAICFVSPKALAMPEVLKAHEQDIRKTLRPIKTFQRVIDKVMYFTPIPVFYGLTGSDGQGLFKWVAFSVFVFCFRPLLFGLLNWYIRKEINKIII